jgi:peptide subunit release factor RF-3
MLVVDSRETPVLLLENEWNIRWAEEKNAGLVLTDIQGATDGGHS